MQQFFVVLPRLAITQVSGFTALSLLSDCSAFAEGSSSVNSLALTSRAVHLQGSFTTLCESLEVDRFTTQLHMRKEKMFQKVIQFSPFRHKI